MLEHLIATMLQVAPPIAAGAFGIGAIIGLSVSLRHSGYDPSEAVSAALPVRIQRRRDPTDAS